jgi:hypothetical protein
MVSARLKSGQTRPETHNVTAMGAPIAMAAAAAAAAGSVHVMVKEELASTADHSTHATTHFECIKHRASSVKKHAKFRAFQFCSTPIR